MRKTKLRALLLAVAMIASMVVPSVAAEDVYTISVVDDYTGEATIDANAGDEIWVKLVLSGNPGVSCISVLMDYPDDWTIQGTDDYKLFNNTASPVVTPGPTDADPFKVVWLMATGTTATRTDPGGKLSTENGNLYAVGFKIPDDAATGTYTISLAVDAANNFYYNVDGNGVIIPNGGNTKLTPAVENMTINVTGTEPAGEACPEHTDVTTWTDVAAADWAAGGAIASGHYKLTEDIATTAALTVAEGETVCIDLAGFDITAGAKAAASSVSYRVFENAGTLAIVDTTATGEGDTYTAGIISGGAMKTQGNSTTSNSTGYGGNVLNTGTFTLVDGIIADGLLTGGAYDSGDNGANIYSKGGVLNIKGGWVKDGRINRTSQTGTLQGGGNIYTTNTDVNITGGMITGGKIRFTSSGNETTYSSSTTADRKGYLNGGNMFVSGGSLDIANAIIADGYIAQSYSNAKAHVVLTLLGGNIYINNADTNITNSTITGGYLSATAVGGKYPASASLSDYIANAVAQGGNIYFKNSSKTLNIDADTVISGGTTIASATKHASSTATETKVNTNYRGGNIYLESGIANIYGEISNGSGQRGGGIFTPGSSTINVYEGAVFSGNDSTDNYGHAITTTAQSAVLNIYGGTLTSAESSGATVYALYAPINIYGGVVENTGGGFAIQTYYSSSNGASVITQTNGTVSGKVKLDTSCEWNVTGGTIDPVLSGAGTLTIGAGVTSYINPEAYMVDCVAYNAIADYYVTYATLADALVAVQSGNTITLVADATADVVTVPAGVTLDLNGNTLTADEFSSAFTDAHVIDSIGTGKLTAGSFAAAEGNNQLPIKSEGGYVFETVSFKENLTVDTTAVYKFYIDSEAAQTLIDDAILNGEAVAINIKVTWTNANNEPKEKTFTLGEELLAQYAGNWDTKMVVLTINDLTGVSDLTCTAQIEANDVIVNA